MNNVGESKAFRYKPSAPTAGLRYVFSFWDGTTEVNTTGTAIKVLNAGGNPADSFLLRWSGTTVDDRGEAAGNSAAFVVNNPPVIVQAPQATVNDAAFPYDTELSLEAYDLEGHVPLSFNWWRGGTKVLYSSGTSTGSVSGTYSGTYTGLAYPARSSHLWVTNVTQPEMVRVDVVDSQSGTTTLNFSLLGRKPTNPYGTPMVETGSLVADASGPPRSRVGAGLKAKFILHTEVLDSGTVTCDWGFPQYLGWLGGVSGTNAPVAYPPVQLANGAYECVVEKPLSETATTARQVQVQATLTHNGKSSLAVLSLILLPNTEPENVAVEVLNQAGTVIELSSNAADVAAASNRIQFRATAVDPDLDLVSFAWRIAVSTTPSRDDLFLYGRTAVIDMTGLTAGNTIGGSGSYLHARDRFGAQVVLGTFPTITIT